MGHRQLPWPPEKALQRLDGLQRGVLDVLPADATLLVTSDHSNLEDMSTHAHTYNPVPLIIYGPDAPAFADVTDLTGVTPAILDALRPH